MKNERSFSSSELVFKNGWPRPTEIGAEVLFIYDKILLNKSTTFKKWIQSAVLQYPVQAGESLKDIRYFANHIEAITKLTQKTSVRQLTICVIGGGSVGDFGGFVASVLKRGVKLVHIPSTWLAALDSAHGGKTALNVAKAKNQIGTFYPAQKIFLIRDLLNSQPSARTFEGFSELFKVALLQGGSFWQRLSLEKELNATLLWKYLPEAIQAKMTIVAKDPEEKSGHRHLLNLGHTLGHVLESYYGLPHGVAVNYGLDFSLRWSLQKKILKTKEDERLRSAPLSFYLLSASRDQLVPRGAKPLAEFERLLLNDKKKTKSSKVRFVFLQKPGSPVIAEVTPEQILAELKRQDLEAKAHA